MSLLTPQAGDAVSTVKLKVTFVAAKARKPAGKRLDSGHAGPRLTAPGIDRALAVTASR